MNTPPPYKLAAERRGGFIAEGPGMSLAMAPLFPERVGDEKAAQLAVIMANVAYREGYYRAQADIRAALGVCRA